MRTTTTTGVLAGRRERGATLVEGLIAILIFSIGILAIMALHAASIKNTTDAQYRSEAAYLANGVLARIRVAQQATVAEQNALAADFASPSGTEFTAWKDMWCVPGTPRYLPACETNPPLIVFAGGPPPRQVTVTVRWQAQSDSGARRHVVETQLD